MKLTYFSAQTLPKGSWGGGKTTSYLIRKGWHHCNQLSSC